jgi:acyl carrier protein
MNRSSLKVPDAATIEARLRAKWAELLVVDAEQISLQSDFFNLGGNSMLLLSLHVFVSQEFNVSLLIPDLVKNAVFIHLVELIQNGTPLAIQGASE